MSLYLSTPLFFVLGVLTWTFAEYAIHRGLGHRKRFRNPFTPEHLRHHRETHYFAPTYKKAIAAVIVLSLNTLLFGLILTWSLAFSFSLGLSIMYVVYEIVHRRAHTHGPSNAYGKWVRKHHFFHHFKNPHVNHGVTSPIWDLVFGTLVRPDVVQVPKKLALSWMIDPATGDIYEQYANDYKLRGGGTAKV